MGHLVYSTDLGRTCPACRQALTACRCKEAAKQAALPAGDGTVRVSRETKGRNGKAVTLVTGLPLDADSRARLAKQLKALCGSGGTDKDGVLELQGEHRDKVVAHLQKAGYSVKRAGG